MMLAQATNADIGTFISVLSVLAGLAFAGFGIYFGFKRRTVKIDPTPLKVSQTPKRYNHELTEQRYNEVSGRLDGHDVKFQEIWKTMRAEDAAIRMETTRCFRDIERALGRIEGKIDRQ